MPDGKELVGEDAPPPAPRPLVGTSVVHVVWQNPDTLVWHTRVTTIGAIAEDLLEPVAFTYSRSGTYDPGLSAGDVAGTASLYYGALGFSRVGNGAGVPSAGDTVTVYGGIEFVEFVADEFFSIALPFERDESPISVSITLGQGEPVSCKATPDPADSSKVLFYMDDASTQTAVNITVTYQTANAVDP